MVYYNGVLGVDVVLIYRTRYGDLFQCCTYPGQKVITSYVRVKDGQKYWSDEAVAVGLATHITDPFDILGLSLMEDVAEVVATEISNTTKKSTYIKYTKQYEFEIYVPSEVDICMLETVPYKKTTFYSFESVIGKLPQEPPLYVDIHEICAYDVKLEAYGTGKECELYLMKVDERSRFDGYVLEKGWYLAIRT